MTYTDQTDYDNTNICTLSIDFDGVIHDATGGWKQGECYGKPVKGSQQAIRKLMDRGYTVVILTARDDVEPVRQWLQNYDFPMLEVSNVKKPSRAYIDDRAIRFTTWDDIKRYFI
jgi:5'(3')-deoxyribonucleotidase